jgi:hypothetical protein
VLQGVQAAEVLQALVCQLPAISQVKVLQGVQAAEVLQALVCQLPAISQVKVLQGVQAAEVLQASCILQDPIVRVATGAVTSRTNKD